MWKLCKWFVTSDDLFYDSLIKVDSGTDLTGIIQLVSNSGDKYNYTSSFLGYKQKLEVSNTVLLFAPVVSLETYFVKNCDQFPADEKINFHDIQIKDDAKYPRLIWYKQDGNLDCGQLCKIVSSSSKEGSIDIYFRTPHRDDYFDIIHLYPNPVKDVVYIKALREIKDFGIEIFDYNGHLIRQISEKQINFDFSTLDYTYTLDLRSYPIGLYIIKVDYEGKSHGFKIIRK